MGAVYADTSHAEVEPELDSGQVGSERAVDTQEECVGLHAVNSSEVYAAGSVLAVSDARVTPVVESGLDELDTPVNYGSCCCVEKVHQ